MKNRYAVSIGVPEWPHSTVFSHARSFKSRERAIRFAERVLDRHSQEVTRDGGGDRDVYSAVVTDEKTGTREYVEAPVVIVPSASELGYW